MLKFLLTFLLLIVVAMTVVYCKPCPMPERDLLHQEHGDVEHQHTGIVFRMPDDLCASVSNATEGEIVPKCDEYCKHRGYDHGLCFATKCTCN